VSRFEAPIVNAFRENGQLIILIICFSVGAFIGCLFAIFFCGGSNLKSYLTDHLVFAAASGLTVSPVAVFWNCFRWILLAGLFSYTAIGTLAIPVLLLLRGFFLTYTSVCFGIIYKYDGLIISLVLFSAAVLLELPAVFMLYNEFLRVSRSRILSGGTTHPSAIRTEILLFGTGMLVLSSALQLTVIPDVFAAVCERIFY